jgi:hypothetical protein
MWNYEFHNIFSIRKAKDTNIMYQTNSTEVPDFITTVQAEIFSFWICISFMGKLYMQQFLKYLKCREQNSFQMLFDNVEYSKCQQISYAVRQQLW